MEKTKTRPGLEGRQGQPQALARRTKRRLSRDHIPIDATLDLHGLTQHKAHRALERFIADAAQRRLRHVLIVTGKGLRYPGANMDGYESYAEGRGVLRRNVPKWLREPGLAHFINGISEAGARHGGQGALYVKIKRRR